MNPSIYMHPTGWVYILQLGSDYRIGQTPDPAGLLRQEEGAQIVYLRAFDNLLDALGHKLLLERLSVSSLYRLIHKQNPGMEDLRKREGPLSDQPINYTHI